MKRLFSTVCLFSSVVSWKWNLKRSYALKGETSILGMLHTCATPSQKKNCPFLLDKTCPILANLLPKIRSTIYHKNDRSIPSRSDTFTFFQDCEYQDIRICISCSRSKIFKPPSPFPRTTRTHPNRRLELSDLRSSLWGCSSLFPHVALGRKKWPPGPPWIDVVSEILRSRGDLRIDLWFLVCLEISLL